MLYRIKPLAWRDSWPGEWIASTQFDEFAIYAWGDKYRFVRTDELFDTLEEAQAACQRYWESDSGIGQYLERDRSGEIEADEYRRQLEENCGKR